MKINQIIVYIWDAIRNNFAEIRSCEEESLRINSILGSTVDTANVTIYDYDDSIRINLMHDIRIIRVSEVDEHGDITSSQVIFGGIITNCTSSVDGIHRVYSLSCQDYSLFLNTTFCDKTFRSGYSDKQIINKCFDDPDWGTLAATHEISADRFVETGLNSMAGAAFNIVSLADILNTITSYSGFSYYVDYEKELHYYSKNSERASFSLSSKPVAENEINYRNIRVKRDGTSLRNQFIVYGRDLNSEIQNSYITADGINTKYLIGMEEIGHDVVMLAPPGEKRIIIEVDGKRRIVGVAGGNQELGDTSTDPSKVDVIISPISKWIEFYLPPDEGSIIHLQYVFSYDYGQLEEDNGSIEKYLRPYMKVIGTSDSNSILGINLKAKSYKEQFSREMITVYLLLDSTLLGNHSVVTGSWVHLSDDILEIDEDFLIYSVSIRVIGECLLEYELELRSWWQNHV